MEHQYSVLNFRPFPSRSLINMSVPECGICLEAFVLNGPHRHRRLPCGHVYCQSWSQGLLTPPPHCVPPDGGTGKTLCSRLQEIFLRRGDQSAAPCPSCRADFVAVPIATDPVVTAAVVAAMDTPEAREISARKREVDESRGVHTGTYVPPCSGWSL